MTISAKDLEKIMRLAYLDIDSRQLPQLLKELNELMDRADQLSSINTEKVAPLLHPLALHQPLRADVVTEESCLRELQALAPVFAEDLYLVPPVIEQVPS